MPGARIDDDERSQLRIDRDPVGRHNPHQPVIHGPLEGAAIDHQLDFVAEHVRNSLGKRGKSRGSQAVAQRCLTIAGKYGTSGWFGTARREPR